MEYFLEGFTDELTKTAGRAKALKGLSDRARRALLTKKYPRHGKGLSDVERRALLSKKADAEPIPGVSKKLKELLGSRGFKRPATRLAGNAAGIAALHKMIDPDVSLGSALGGGVAITGGGAAGQAIGSHMGAGARGRAGLSILGSVIAARAIRNRQKKKRKRKAAARRGAREDLMAEHAMRSRK